MTKQKYDLQKLIKKQKWYYVNENLTTKNFPMPDVIETKDWKLITLDRTYTSQQCLDKIKAEGCRPANVYELALWANAHREEVPKGKWYVALGQLWCFDGYHRVPYVNAYSVGAFGFYLGFFEVDWSDGNCLLCFCDKTLDTRELKTSSDTLSLENRVKILEDFNERLIKAC